MPTEEEWWGAQMQDLSRYDGEQTEKEWAEYEVQQAQEFEMRNDRFFKTIQNENTIRISKTHLSFFK